MARAIDMAYSPADARTSRSPQPSDPSVDPGDPAIDVRVGCEFQFESFAEAPSVFQVQPHPAASISLHREAWTTSPTLVGREYLDSFQNRCRRMEIPQGSLMVRYEAAVAVPAVPDAARPDATQTPVDALPSGCLQFTLPSRYCLSDVLSGAAWDLFDDIQPGWAQVQAVCDWVHTHVAYTLGSSTPLTDATDVYMSRQGVCRDFAHLAISFCRALNYPARYAYGYLPLVDGSLPKEGMDFAAWMEVFVGGDWYTFDPRNNARRTGRVLIGRGRDALDVAMVTSAGAPWLASMRVWAEAV